MKFSILILLVLFLSCSNSHKELMSDFSADFPKTEELTKISEIQLNEFYSPYELIVKDSLLFVLEETSDFVIRCINLNTKKELARINKGHASNELIYAGTITLYGDNSLMAVDFGSSVVKTFNIKEMISQPIFSANTIKIKSLGANLVRISDDEFLCSGQNDSLNNYFIVKGDNVEAFGKENLELSALDESIDINPYLLWSRELKANKERRKVISATRMGLLFEVIDIEKKCVDAHRYYEKINFKMGVEGIEMTNTLSMKTIFCSNDKVFIILAEQTSPLNEDYKKAKFKYSMLTFDWKLNPLKKYNLNTPSHSAFYVSQNGENLTILSTKDEEKGYKLTKYKI